jgi:hypothetical protein
MDLNDPTFGDDDPIAVPDDPIAVPDAEDIGAVKGTAGKARFPWTDINITSTLLKYICSQFFIKMESSDPIFGDDDPVDVPDAEVRGAGKGGSKGRFPWIYVRIEALVFSS